MPPRVAAWTLMAVLAAGISTRGWMAPVTMLATVVASPAGPLNHLSAKDFAIAGSRAVVVKAVPATQPLSIALLVDVSRPPTSAPPIDDAALEAFVHTIRNTDPDAQIALTRVAGTATSVATFDSSSAALVDALRTITSGQETSAALIEAIDRAGRILAAQPAPRRAIVSVDLATPDPILDTAVDATVKDVFESGATVWAVCDRRTVHQQLIREEALDTIVKGNGGQRTTTLSTGLHDQLQTIANSLLSQYLLTIADTDPQHVKQLKISTTGGAKVVPSTFARLGVELADNRRNPR